jgi:hypothetical protein
MNETPARPRPVVGEKVRRSGRLRRSLSNLARMAQTVADADATRIELAAQQLGESRRYLAPVAWAAGALVLLVRGIKLLLLNWRLLLIELVPAAWVWFIMWELKQHALRGAPFRQITLGGMALAAVASVVLTVISFWCNTVFGYAISNPSPEIAPAVRQARAHRVAIAAAGTGVGLVIALAVAGIPRIGSTPLYIAALSGVLGLLLVSLVAVPARLIGRQRSKLPPKQSFGRWAAGSALSAVAMTPGLLLDRLGIILLGVPGLHVVGLLLLSVGAALYAAGLSSVRAVKLTMKLGDAT